MQRRRRGDHDAKRDAIRERHADAGIHRHASQMVPRVGCLCEEGVLAHKLHVLDFLRRLPEKDIGADRRSEHRNNCQKIVCVYLKRRFDYCREGLYPLDMDRKNGGNIYEKDEGEPFQHVGVAAIGDDDFGHGAENTK